MSAEQSKTIARRYYVEVHNQRDLDVVEELLAPDFAHHDPFPETTPDREGVKQMFGLFRTAFPDAEFVIEEIVAGEDNAAVRWTLRGTHEGEWLDLPPTGRRFEISGMHMIRIQGGKIVEERGQARPDAAAGRDPRAAASRSLTDQKRRQQTEPGTFRPSGSFVSSACKLFGSRFPAARSVSRMSPLPSWLLTGPPTLYELTTPRKSAFRPRWERSQRSRWADLAVTRS